MQKTAIDLDFICMALEQALVEHMSLPGFEFSK